ncbi:hypothetical protein EJB05_36898, partial [Eragrostis curvula]
MVSAISSLTRGTSKLLLAFLTVWNIHSSNPIAKLEGSYAVDYLSGDSQHRDLLIWDLRTADEERVHGFGVCGRYTQDIACHPALPILVTSIGNRTLCLWDATTYSKFVENGEEKRVQMLVVTMGNIHDGWPKQ